MHMTTFGTEQSLQTIAEFNDSSIFPTAINISGASSEDLGIKQEMDFSSKKNNKAK